VRIIGRLTPEEILVDLCDEVIALKSLAFVELIVGEFRRLITFGFQACDLFL
jgi:hypothetical protein